MSEHVSYAMCKEVVEHDARIIHFAILGCWRVFIDDRMFEGLTRDQAIREAATDLQRRLEKDLVA